MGESNNASINMEILNSAHRNESELKWKYVMMFVFTYGGHKNNRRQIIFWGNRKSKFRVIFVICNFIKVMNFMIPECSSTIKCNSPWFSYIHGHDKIPRLDQNFSVFFVCATLHFPLSPKLYPVIPAGSICSMVSRTVSYTKYNYQWWFYFSTIGIRGAKPSD